MRTGVRAAFRFPAAKASTNQRFSNSKKFSREKGEYRWLEKEPSINRARRMSASAIDRAPIIRPTRNPAVDQVRTDRPGIPAQAAKVVKADAKAAPAKVDSKVASGASSKVASGASSKVVSINSRAASVREAKNSTRAARASTKTNNSKASTSRAANNKAARAAASKRVAKETADHKDHKVDPVPAALNSTNKVVSISRADRASSKADSTKARSPKVDEAHRADRSPASRASQASLTAKKKTNAATSNLRKPGRSRNETG